MINSPILTETWKVLFLFTNCLAYCCSVHANLPVPIVTWYQVFGLEWTTGHRAYGGRVGPVLNFAAYLFPWIIRKMRQTALRETEVPENRAYRPRDSFFYAGFIGFEQNKDECMVVPASMCIICRTFCMMCHATFCYPQVAEQKSWV